MKPLSKTCTSAETPETGFSKYKRFLQMMKREYHYSRVFLELLNYKLFFSTFELGLWEPIQPLVIFGERIPAGAKQQKAKVLLMFSA